MSIVLSVGVNGATVSQVAHRHEIRRQQIYAWRYELRKKGLLTPDDTALFLPVDIALPPGPPEACVPDASSLLIEVVLREGRSLRVDARVDAAVLTRLIQAVEAA